MSMMVSFVLSFFPRDVLDEILNLIESVSEDFPSYSLNADICMFMRQRHKYCLFANKTGSFVMFTIFSGIHAILRL